jgi:hypothetical protein
VGEIGGNTNVRRGRNGEGLDSSKNLTASHPEWAAVTSKEKDSSSATTDACDWTPSKKHTLRYFFPLTNLDGATTRVFGDVPALVLDFTATKPEQKSPPSRLSVTTTTDIIALVAALGVRVFMAEVPPKKIYVGLEKQLHRVCYAISTKRKIS